MHSVFSAPPTDVAAVEDQLLSRIPRLLDGASRRSRFERPRHARPRVAVERRTRAAPTLRGRAAPRRCTSGRARRGGRPRRPIAARPHRRSADTVVHERRSRLPRTRASRASRARRALRRIRQREESRRERLGHPSSTDSGRRQHGRVDRGLRARRSLRARDSGVRPNAELYEGQLRARLRREPRTWQRGGRGVTAPVSLDLSSQCSFPEDPALEVRQRSFAPPDRPTHSPRGTDRPHP